MALLVMPSRTKVFRIQWHRARSLSNGLAKILRGAMPPFVAPACQDSQAQLACLLLVDHFPALYNHDREEVSDTLRARKLGPT